MKNMKVRTKLNLILVLVILLVALGGTVSVKDMEDVKDKALETMEASSRQSYDDSIKEQVEVVISLLSEINDAYKAGTYTLDEAKKIAADEVRQMRYGEAGYFWIDQSDGTNVVLLGSDTEGTNRMETKDAKGNRPDRGMYCDACGCCSTCFYDRTGYYKVVKESCRRD